MPMLLAPLALIGLAALPALAAIYWLRNRYRPRTVSSLILWQQVTESREGGRRLDRIQAPPLFLLELLAILLLVLAAAAPHLRAGARRAPILVILDDSYSMLGPGAGEGDARSAAVEAIADRLESGRYAARFVLAGPGGAQLLGETAREGEQARSLLRDHWRPGTTRADLDRALAFTRELAGGALILVLSDRPPPNPPESGRVEWRAVGRSAPNIAIVEAHRAASGERHRCLIEVANLADEPAATRLTLEAIDIEGDAPPRHVRTWELDFSPGQTRRVFFDLAAETPALRARLGEDSLDIDNRAVLLPPADRTVAVSTLIIDERLNNLVRRAVEASANADLASPSGAGLLMTDQPGRPEDPRAWTVRFIAGDGPEPRAYAGPFITDHTHAFTRGLTLDGVIWSPGGEPASEGSGMAGGRPIIAAGNTVLLADLSQPGQPGRARIRYDPDLSNLHDTPNWPILIANLIDWRADALPGLRRRNLRVGDEAVLVTDAADPPAVRITGPLRGTTDVPVTEGRATVRADRPGLYTARTGDDTEHFTANALHRETSDLRGRAAGRWGAWDELEAGAGQSYRNYGWLLALLAAAALTAHLALIARSSSAPMRAPGGAGS